MKRLTGFVILMPLMFSLGGCSVFGVATKGDLDKLAQEDAQARQMLVQRIERVNDQLASIAQNLEDIERRMEPRLTDLETNVQQLDQQVASSQQQLLDLELGLRTDLDQVRNDVQVVYDDMQFVRTEMNSVTGDVQMASQRSQQALEAHYYTMIDERERLVAYLATLDEKIEKWHVDLQKAAQPDSVEELGQQALVPEDLGAQTRERENPDQIIQEPVILESQTIVPEQSEQETQQAEESFRLGPHNREDEDK